MSQYQVTFPPENAPGNFPPYAACQAVLELVNTQEDAVGPNATHHRLTFLTSMAPEVIAARLAAPHEYHNPDLLRTRHIVACWESEGFRQYLVWDSTKQAIVDMLEA